MLKVIYILFTVSILLLAVDCSASDYGAPLHEFDTRSDEVLTRVAKTEMLVGKWYGVRDGDDKIPMIISDSHISEYGCSAKYSIVRTTVSSTLPDHHTVMGGPEILTIGRAVSIKLKIEKSKCYPGDNFGYIQFSFLTASKDGTYNYARIAQYDVNDRPISWYYLKKMVQSRRSEK
jgi:hypothetical protein